MMEPDVRDLIERIHDTPHKVVSVTTGAGTLSQAWLFGVAGASRTMLESHVPYSKQSFIDLIGQEPKKYVSGKAARLLAGYALNRAGQLAGSVQYPILSDIPLIGLSCSGAIATDRPKRGHHHAYIALWMENQLSQTYIRLDKNMRDRQREEDLVGRLILNQLALACGITNQLPLDLFPGDQIEETVSDFDHVIQQLLDRDVNFVGIYSHGEIRTENLNPTLLMSGSFNPLHIGHRKLANVATKLMGHPIAFEISVFNVDKPPLEKSVILKRLTQFAGHHPIYLTNAPTFNGKARLFPNTVFVVGYDTAERILMPKYYNQSRDEMERALHEMMDLNCQFLVAGRTGKDGVYDSAADLEIPSQFKKLFEPIGDELFREDISSSEIRKSVERE